MTIPPFPEHGQPDNCPKCGFHSYKVLLSQEHVLIWTCYRCGYETLTQTMDACDNPPHPDFP